jgi:hypothetical protein
MIYLELEQEGKAWHKNKTIANFTSKTEEQKEKGLLQHNLTAQVLESFI